MRPLLLTALLVPTVASAYTPRQQSGCAEITFAAPPRVILHTAEAHGFSLIDVLQLAAAMDDVHANMEGLGGTWARVDGFTVSADPFVFQRWFGDAVPTIHVGFTDDPTANPGGAFWDVDRATCTIREAHIQFQDADTFAWQLMEPGTYGFDYWVSGLSNPSGRYFRVSYVHELLHAFGLAHSNDGYAMLNYGDRPWANRDPGDRIRPLPDDLRGLRHLYPALTTRHEVAVLNTWFEPTSGGTYPAADQGLLCAPAKGASWADRYDPLCAQNGTTEVCPGDLVRVRYTVANYSTEDVDVTARLWFSLDEELSRASGDVRSPTSYATTIAGSGLRGQSFEVPTGLPWNTEVQPILKVKGESVSGVPVSDWIPLTGTLHVKSWAECNRLSPGTLPPPIRRQTL